MLPGLLLLSRVRWWSGLSEAPWESREEQPIRCIDTQCLYNWHNNSVKKRFSVLNSLRRTLHLKRRFSRIRSSPWPNRALNASTSKSLDELFLMVAIVQHKKSWSAIAGRKGGEKREKERNETGFRDFFNQSSPRPHTELGVLILSGSDQLFVYTYVHLPCFIHVSSLMFNNIQNILRRQQPSVLAYFIFPTTMLTSVKSFEKLPSKVNSRPKIHLRCRLLLSPSISSSTSETWEPQKVNHWFLRFREKSISCFLCFFFLSDFLHSFHLWWVSFSQLTSLLFLPLLRSHTCSARTHRLWEPERSGRRIERR